MTGIELIAKERARQISEEGWTPEHDDTHKHGELAAAAAAYANWSTYGSPGDGPPPCWPADWGPEWWKPRGRLRNLERAGALVAAEIDRIQRLDGGAVGFPRCPLCNSPDPKKHPAVQFEGEVEICKDPFHAAADPPDGEHPETTCERCGGRNVVWHAPSPIWNKVVREANDGRDLMLCPICFVELAEQTGVQATSWRVCPEDWEIINLEERVRILEGIIQP